MTDSIPTTASTRRWWIVPLACLGVMLAAFLLALSWRLQEHSAGRLSPLGMRRLWALALSLVIVPAGGLIIVAVQQQLRFRSALALIALLLLGVAGGGALIVLLDSRFPFGDEYLLSARSPDGRDEGHVYVGSFFGCSYSLFRGPANAMFVESISSAPVDCARRREVRVVWPADGGVEVATDAGVIPAPFTLTGPWH